MNVEKLAEKLNQAKPNKPLESYWVMGRDTGESTELRFNNFCKARRAQYASFNPSLLVSTYIQHFNAGLLRRIEVYFPTTKKKVWGFIGVSGGAQPCFLLVKNIGQQTGIPLTSECQVVSIKNGTDRIKSLGE